MLDVERGAGRGRATRSASGCATICTIPFCQTSSRSRVAEQQRDRAGAQQRHHDQRGIHVGVGGPALRPLQVPAEAGLDADHLGHDQHGEGRAEPHEQADEDVRQRGGDRDLEHQEATAWRRACARRRNRRC